MTESESVALPLGDTPICVSYFIKLRRNYQAFLHGFEKFLRSFSKKSFSRRGRALVPSPIVRRSKPIPAIYRTHPGRSTHFFRPLIDVIPTAYRCHPDRSPRSSRPFDEFFPTAHRPHPGRSANSFRSLTRSSQSSVEPGPIACRAMITARRAFRNRSPNPIERLDSPLISRVELRFELRRLGERKAGSGH